MKWDEKSHLIEFEKSFFFFFATPYSLQDFSSLIRDLTHTLVVEWQPTPVLLPGESHGQRNLAGYSPWGLKELDTTERLTHTHTYILAVKEYSSDHWTAREFP